MAIVFNLAYQSVVVQEDIPKLSPPIRKKIKLAIEQKLTTNPEHFGKPLRRSLHGYCKLRVGDYRVVFRIENTTIKIFAIMHRSVVYERASQRII